MTSLNKDISHEKIGKVTVSNTENARRREWGTIFPEESITRPHVKTPTVRTMPRLYAKSLFMWIRPKLSWGNIKVKGVITWAEISWQISMLHGAAFTIETYPSTSRLVHADRQQLNDVQNYPCDSSRQGEVWNEKKQGQVGHFLSRESHAVWA